MTQYFHPEPGAPTNRMLSFARGFARAGHRVDVLCEFPCYPSGKLEKKDRFRLFRKEKFEDFTIFRVFVIPTRRAGVFSRMINYWSYTVSSFIIGIFLKRPDIIVASSPPLFVAPSAVLLSLLKRVPLVADIRDLWPEYAVHLGLLHNPLAIWGSSLTAAIFYKRAAVLSVVTNGVKDYFRTKIKGKEVIVVTNGSSIPDLHPDLRAEPLKDGKDIITICYAGSLGLTSPIEDIIEVASSTRDDDSIKYLIVGEGVRRQYLMELSENKELNNIRFVGMVSFNESLDYMKNADIAIVSLLPSEIFNGIIPSKFYDCMALGLPVILGVDGEARQILERYRTGLFYKSRDWRDLADKIYYLKNNPDLAAELGKNGRELVSREYRRSDLVAKFEEFLRSRFQSEEIVHE